MSKLASSLRYVIRQRSFWVALALWIAISLGVVTLSGGTMPLPIGPHPDKPLAIVVSSWIALVFLLLEAWLVAFIALSLFAEWLGKRNLVKRREKLISDSSIIVSMDENGVDVVAENSNSHSKWAGMLPPLAYPHGVLIKFSRLSGIWLPDQALIEGSPDDVRKLLAENVKDSGPGRK